MLPYTLVNFWTSMRSNECSSSLFMTLFIYLFCLLLLLLLLLLIFILLLLLLLLLLPPEYRQRRSAIKSSTYNKNQKHTESSR